MYKTLVMTIFALGLSAGSANASDVSKEMQGSDCGCCHHHMEGKEHKEHKHHKDCKHHDGCKHHKGDMKDEKKADDKKESGAK